MSDREDSPVANDSDHHSADKKSVSRESSVSVKDEKHASRSKSRSHSRSRSYSRKRHHSRFRSHSRGRKHRHLSRSRSRSPRKRRRYSKSKSRSYSPKRSHSPRYSGGNVYRDRYSRRRSPDRRRNLGNRVCQENPEPCRCLGVFGLSLYTHERELQEVFRKYGPIEDVQIIYDAQSGRSRGFAFVYYEDVDDATTAKESCNGIEIDGRKIRVDYSVTKRAHTPTPGIYMGNPTYSKYGGRDRRNGGYYRDRGRSPSPYHNRRRYSRSRSRSYSPGRSGYY